MAKRHHNVVLTEDVAWEFEDAVGDKTAKCKGVYTDDWEGWLNRAPQLGSAHPDFPAMTLQRRKAAREPGTVVRVEIYYESRSTTYDGRPDDPIRRYDQEVTLSDEPLLSHPRYADLDADEQEALQQIINGTLKKENGEDWADDVESEEGLEALAKIRRGQTMWREPRLVWVERSTVAAEDLDDAVDLGTVGQVDAPPGGAPTGGNRDYMFLAGPARMTEDGEYYDLELRWELSGPEGWDEDLYANNPW